MLLQDQVDVAAHPPHTHPLDPYTNGHLVFRAEGNHATLIEASEHILLDCGLLWDLANNSKIFAAFGIRLFPPEHKLDLKATVNGQDAYVPDGQHVLWIGEWHETNRPTPCASARMCQHWAMAIDLNGKRTAYRIGDWRPKMNVMEATRLDAA
jgi:hypothetical protein